jgi:hypothetical protein
MRAIAAAVIHPAVPPPTITIDRIRSATLFLPKNRYAASLQHTRHFLSGSAQHVLPKAAHWLKQKKC